MHVSYGLPYVTPELVSTWEHGIARNAELTAPAGVLWCFPGELAGRPRALREHRVARGLAPEDVAGAVGVELRAYLWMEETDGRRGTERRSALLAQVLGLSPLQLVTDSPGWTNGFETTGPEDFLHRIVDHFRSTVREFRAGPR
jgi:transcriptional regulator with XRE-family HTH domain